MSAVDFHGQTTLITGASSGIGAEFARRIAARGSDLVLVARRESRLESLADELRGEYGVTVDPVVLDLSEPSAGARLSETVAQRDIVVTSVINNAGFATHGPFHEASPERLRNEIAVNVHSVVDISRMFIDRLRAADGGVLLNLASLAAYQADPTMAVYGATKAFVLSFTEALWYESRGTGLRVMALSPGATDTEFFDVAGADADGGTARMSTEQVVATALKALDRTNPPPSLITGALNRMTQAGAALFSRRRKTMALGAMMSRTAAPG